VSSALDESSSTPAERVAGSAVLVFDDMVRTGGTLRESCRVLKELGAEWVGFFVTHFYASREVRENLNCVELNEIITTNALPYILNRDEQGRLRRKMAVLKIEKWIGDHLMHLLELGEDRPVRVRYGVDISSKNPRSGAR
jgi:ribose-phosphate pyrophosphokinase